MPFLSREEAEAARARGEQVVALPSSPPDGLVHYASTKRHFMCDPPSMHNKTGSPDWSRVTCPECLRMGKRTGRQEGGRKIDVIRDMEKARNQHEEEQANAEV